MNPSQLGIEMDALVLMACSGTKLNAPAPAFDLYQGVMYETFRVHAKPHARPNVIILSALHGFVDPTTVLAPYDLKMTEERAQEMLSNLPRFMNQVIWPRNVSRVFLAGGSQYRRVMRAAIESIGENFAIDECSGGIGAQRSQLGRYLDSLGERGGKVVGHHPNGTPLFASMEKFDVGSQVVTQYRSAPNRPQSPGIVRELFVGPSGPTATIDLLDGKKLTSRWINLKDIQMDRPSEAKHQNFQRSIFSGF